MNPEPLKMKEIVHDTETWPLEEGINNLCFMKEDVAAAIEWLKSNFNKGLTLWSEEYIQKKIDEAFADVVDKKGGGKG
jgi:hypothetical protein